MRQRARREAKAAAGYCITCGVRKRAEGRSLCHECREWHRLNSARRRREWGVPAMKDRQLKEGASAEKKREREKKNYRERLAKGLCGYCGKAPAALGRRRCESCLHRARQVAQRQFEKRAKRGKE